MTGSREHERNKKKKGHNCRGRTREKNATKENFKKGSNCSRDEGRIQSETTKSVWDMKGGL